MSDLTDSIYKTEILEHFHEPQNFGVLSIFDARSTLLNPYCGDEITMYVKFSGRRIIDISFSGKGCAISISGTSILTEFVKGKTRTQLTKFTEDDMVALLGIDISESRKKCALLGWAILQDCLK